MSTRFFLPGAAIAADLAPTISAEWEHQNSDRRRMDTRKMGTAMVTITYTPDAVDHITDADALFVQYISRPLIAQSIPSQTLNIAVYASEANAGNNCVITWKVFLCDATGAVGSTILAIQRDGLELGTSASSRADTGTSTGVTSAPGDRIVLELGIGGVPVATSQVQGHNGAISTGDSSASDYTAGTDSDGVLKNPWFEFASTTLTFLNAPPPFVRPWRRPTRIRR